MPLSLKHPRCPTVPNLLPVLALPIRGNRTKVDPRAGCFCVTTIPGPVPLLKPAFGCILSSLLLSVTLSAATDVPDSAEQQRILEKVRQTAVRYLENLPNFVCSRVTEQFDAGRKPDHWRQRDTITERLIFNKGQENLAPELLNGKPVKPGQYIDRPLRTSGEFGELLHTVLDEKSAAQISWSRWENLLGRRLAVFEYSIDAQHSMISLGVTGVDLILPYRGLLYADPDTGELWRITSELFDLPEDVQTKSLVTTIDYGLVDITNRKYIMPVSASVALDTGQKNILNKMSFTQYRKFETDSKITFVSGSN